MTMNEKPDKDETTDEGIGQDFVQPTLEPQLVGAGQRPTVVGLGTSASDLSALQDFFEALPAAVYTCEASSGVITFYNKHAVRLWGRTPNLGDTDERFCGSLRLWRPDGTPLPHNQTPMAVALRDGHSFRNEEVLIERPDGTRINVLVNIDPIHDKTGRVAGAINAFHDITPLKQAEEAQARLAAIVETSDDAIVSKSLDGIIQSWNAAAERIFGYSAAEAIGKPINLIIPPELQDEERYILERLRQGERIEHFETVRLSKGGDHIDISLTISPLRDATGQVIGASKVARDISHRQRTERALKAKEAELELIAETTPLILIRCSRDLRYLFANRAAAALFNLTPDEMIGKPIIDIMGQEAFSIIKPRIEQVLQGEPVEFEAELPYTGTGPRWVHVNYLPERDEYGHVIGWVASIVDITKRKKAEEALNQLTETLEERVEERTLQVRQLASELVTAEQAVRRRIAHLLHDDLQQMLYATEMQLTFLRDDIGEKDQVDAVAGNIRQALSLTRQLAVELSPPVLEGAGLYETLTWLAQHMADAYQLQVSVEASDIPLTASEEQRILLYQNVRELLFNVVKHAGVQTAQVTLQAQVDGLTVTVSDHGLGFDLTALAAKEKSHFGLHSVHERLQLFGGRATIDSQPGTGTRVTLFLPHGQPAAESKAKE
jgi:PAS domain S-box-containing protein